MVKKPTLRFDTLLAASDEVLEKDGERSIAELVTVLLIRCIALDEYNVYVGSS